MEDLLKLQTRLEKETMKSFNSKDQYFQPMFASFEENLVHQRNTEYHNLKQQINRIRMNVVHFKRTLQSNGTGSSFVEKVKQTLEEIEASILSFKENQRELYEQLLIEEGVVYQEVLAYERRIESWLANVLGKKTASAQPYALVERETVSTGSNVPPAVVTFERFLSQTGGHTGGWEELDHLTYVRLKKKHYQGGTLFIDTIATEIPTHSSDEITQHDKWYNEYCDLLESKRKAIAEWKATRQKSFQRTTDGDNSDVVPVKQTARDELLQKEKAEQLAKLKEWKAERRRQQEEDMIRMEKMKKDDQKKLRLKQITRQTATKVQLEEYAKKKETEKQKKMLEEELKMKKEQQQSKLANKQIQRFQERDALSLKEKLNRASSRELEEIEREKRLDKLKQTVAVRVSRDPTRLLRFTAGWEERKKAEFDRVEYSGSVLHVSRKCVPIWRRGL